MKPPSDSSTMRIAVLVADADLMACTLLSDLLNRHADFEVVDCVLDKASLLHSARQMKSGVALISADLQDGPLSGISATEEIRNIHSGLHVILLLDRPEPALVVEAMRAGARGVFLRSAFEAAALRKCVHRVYEGQFWINTREMEVVLEALTQTRELRVVDAAGLTLLSRREEDVMRLVAEGLGNRDIARGLNLSEHTVKNYLFHIFDKLGISNRVELVLYAMANAKKGDTATPAQRKPTANANALGVGA